MNLQQRMKSFIVFVLITMSLLMLAGGSVLLASSLAEPLSPGVITVICHFTAILFGGWFLSPFILDFHNIEYYTGLGWLARGAKNRIQIILILYIVYFLWHLPVLFS